MVTEKELFEKINSGEITQKEVIDNGWLSSVTNRIKKVKQPRGGLSATKRF